MTDWIASTCSRITDLLTRQGRADLASDLRRVVEVIDLQEVNALMLPDAEKIIDDLAGVETIHELFDQLFAINRVFNIENCSLFVIEEGSGRSYPVRLLTTNSGEWVDFHIKNDIFNTEFAMKKSKELESSFYYNRSEYYSDNMRDYISVSKSYDLGISSYTSIVNLDNNDKIGLLGYSNQAYDDFVERFDRIKGDFEEVAYSVAEALYAVSSGAENPTQLTPDQLRLLRAVSIGSTPEELSTIDFAFGSLETVEKSVLEVLGARTLAEAAVKATQNGVLSSTPLMRNEVFSAGASAERICRLNVTPLERHAGRLRTS